MYVVSKWVLPGDFWVEIVDATGNTRESRNPVIPLYMVTITFPKKLPENFPVDLPGEIFASPKTYQTYESAKLRQKEVFELAEKFLLRHGLEYNKLYSVSKRKIRFRRKNKGNADRN